MPDVKWFSGGGSQFTLLTEGGGNVTLSSGAMILPAGTAANPSLHVGTGMGLYDTGAGNAVGVVDLSDDTEYVRLSSSRGVEIKSGWFVQWGLGATPNAMLVDRGSGVMACGSNSNVAGAFLVGTSSHPSMPASSYLFIEGVSGAGGTPTTAHLNAGAGVAMYTQQTHDGQATKFVIAYNLGGSMRYLAATLDGSTTTWTNSATRP